VGLAGELQPREGVGSAHRGLLAFPHQEFNEPPAVVGEGAAVLFVGRHHRAKAIEIFRDELIEALSIFFLPAVIDIVEARVDKDGEGLINQHHFVEQFHHANLELFVRRVQRLRVDVVHLHLARGDALDHRPQHVVIVEIEVVVSEGQKVLL